MLFFCFAIFLGSPHSNDRDAGFCSGSSEGGDDDFSDNLRLEPSSPTDNSEDSVEVKVAPISLVRNKRKSSEPSKVIEEKSTASQSNGPLKKRIRYTSNTDSGVVLTPPAVTVTSPPPPSSSSQTWDASQILPHELMPNPAQVFVRHPGVTTLHRLPVKQEDLEEEQEEPLALVLKKPSNDAEFKECKTLKNLTPKKRFTREPSIEHTPPKLADNATKCTDTSGISVDSNVTLVPAPALSTSSSSHEESCLNTSGSQKASKPQQRNYKNMTRERRIEANARERSRVHTISAAYETLRKAVPSYSNNQKLSKLSVLRVACSYILTLSRMAGYDYSADESEPSIASCFDAVTATIQTEGKIRKKKDEEK